MNLLVPTSFEITILTNLLVKMWTLSLIWGPQPEFSGETSFEITDLTHFLKDKMRTFPLSGELIVNLWSNFFFLDKFCRNF